MSDFFDQLRDRIANPRTGWADGGDPDEGECRQRLLSPTDRAAWPPAHSAYGPTPPTMETETFRKGAWERTGGYTWAREEN